MVAVARRRSELDARRRQWAPRQLLGCAGRAGAPGAGLARRQEECCRGRGGGESKGSPEDKDGNGRGWIVENKIEMEPKMEAIRKNIKGLFLVEQNCLKKFTIPKKTPDKDFLTDCSANQRDYNEIKQRLNENCLDTQCNLESLWQFHKIEMVHNKDLEEEFIAKRAKLREEGKQDKELSSFLVASRDEVLQICQNGLCTGLSKRELNILKELGNPQLGVYLFRYVDIALNYASKHSVPVENIIIFRVLLGKVKKVQPPKGQKKVVLDPTPNFDCHMSRIQPSLKDSLEDQAVGSLVYFYEYNDLSKPVDKPRQCLPYAVIHVKSANQKRQADSFVTSLKCKLKQLPKHMGRVVPLENCTRVTRIGKSQLIYEHFRKPLEMCVSAEDSSFSRSVQNWNESEDKINCEKKKCKSARRWDSTQMETDIQWKSGVEASIGIRGEHMGDGKKNSLKINLGDSSDCETGSSTVTTSRLIRDPRLTRREQNVVKQNEELIMKPAYDSMSTCKPSPENITSSKGKKHNRGEMDSQFQEEDISPSEIEHSTKCATSSGTLSKAEHGNIFQPACFKKNHVSENNHVYESSSDEITSENVEQNKLQTVKNLNLKSKNSNMAETHKKDKQIYSAPEEANTSPDKDYTIKKIKEKSSKRISNTECIRYHPCDTCVTDTIIRNLSEKSTCLSKTELLDKNNFEDSRTCISLELFTDGPKNCETNDAVGTCFDEICVNKLEEEVSCGKKGKNYNSATETAFKNAAENPSRKKKRVKKDLKKPVGNINNCIETLENSDTLDLESPDFVFNLSFQRSSSTETELMNRECCKEKFEELQDQTLHTKSVNLTGHEKVNGTVLLTSVPTSLKNKGNSEINKPSANTTSSNASSEGLNKNLFCRQVPEILGQDLEIKRDYINIHSLDISGEIENVLEVCKKCLSVWHKPCKHGNTSEEHGYHYLQERLDWDNLFGKPRLNVNLSESPALKENESNSFYGEKSGEEEGTELFNTFSCPDLQITITNIFQSKLETEMEACSTKYSAPKKYIKWSRGKKKKKFTKGQQNSKLYHKKKRLNIHSSSQMFSSLSKGQFKKTKQSEKHIKNILNALNNTEALLCKSKHPSQRIIGAMFHLRKARKSVQRLKTVTKAGRKTPSGTLSKAKEVLQDGALVLDSSETPGCKIDMSCSSDCAKSKVTKTASEKNASLDTTDVKSLEPVSSEPIMCNKKRFAVEGLFGNTQETDQESIIAAVENIKQTLTSDTNSCRSKTNGNQFDSSLKRQEFTVSQRSQTNGGETSKSNVNMSTVTIATPVQPTFESAAKVNVFRSDDISGPYPNFIALKTSHDKEALEISALQEESTVLSAGRCPASSACWSLAEDNLNVKTSVVQLTPEMHSNRSLSLKTKSNSSLNKNVGINCSETPAGSFSRQKQKVDSHCEKDYLKPQRYCLNTFSQTVEQEIYTAENRHCKPLGKSVKYPGNNTKRISSIGDLPSPTSLVDTSLCQSSHHCVLQELEEEDTEETEILETKTDSAAETLDTMHDIPVKSLNNLVLREKTMKQINHVTLGESRCRQTSSGSADNCNQLHFNSLPTAVSEQDLEIITATTILPPPYYHVTPDKTNKLFTTTETKQNESHFSSTSSNHCSDLSNNSRLSKVGIGLKFHDFNFEVSEILRKADKTSSLNILHEQISCCRSVLPLFIRAFERKQGGSFEHVLISREILGSTKRNMQTSPKLKPGAIEALVELQIVMETMEFIENKKKFLKGEPTFRSLLWYDDSLYSELFGGHSGYQQQSNFYPAFQRRLKYSALNELQIYHKQLVETFENTISENNSYYSLLKLRREIEECESVMKQISNLSDFFLSVPFICGANFGDSIEDLENSRKSTVDLINISKSLPGMNLSAEKDHHFWIIMEIIGKKIEFVKTCTSEAFNLKTSLFGLEHIFFDAAKNLVWQETNTFLNRSSKDGKEVLQINEIAVAKLYEIYEHMLKYSGCGNNNQTFGGYTKKCTEDSHNCEEAGSQYSTNCFIGKSLTLQQDSCCISEILDEAQSADTERLQQLMGRCTVHIEMLQKYFQILQEEDVTILITQENVLDFMKNGGIHPVILKPEAIEVYTELAMIHETIFFLKNSIAKQVDKPRFRSLLWFDLSLLPELFRCQEKMASLSYRKDKLLKTVETSISEVQDELNAIYDYAENLNCAYALHLLTRELAELSETRKLLETSTSPVSMCVDLAPYTISLNYGSTLSELDCNYNQFSSLLEKLMLAEKKDLGKMAHIMKVMKTIEHMKFICSEQGKSPLPVVIHQMLKNWRKACQLKRQLMEAQLDHSKQALQASQILHKRPFNVALEDRPCSSEEKIDLSHNKKKKVAASLMTTTKIDEKDTSRNMRNSGKYNSSEGEELQLKIPPDTQNRNIRNLRERTPVTFSQLKAAYPYECIHASTDASELRLNNADALASQQNLQDLKSVKEGRKSSQNAKEHEEYFSSYIDINKCMSVSPVKVQRSEAVSSMEKLGENNSLVATKNAHWELKSDGLQNDSDIQSEYSIGISLSPGNSRNDEKSEIPSYSPTYNSESSVMTELNKSMELQSFHSEPSFGDNIQNAGECSAISQNEYFEGTSTHIYRTVYPYYSWYFYHTSSNSHLVTQTYQELNSYEIYPLNPAVSATASMVNTAYSSRFHTQTISHLVRESQSSNIAQAYPVHGYFSSVAAYPYSYQQQPTWYAENWPLSPVFPYPSNIGL